MPLQLPSGVALADIPAAPPPPGVISNFAHPSATLEPIVIAVSVIFMVFGLSFGAINLLQHRQALKASDWFILAACVLEIVHTAVVLSYCKYNVHQWDLNLAYFNEPAIVKLQFTQNLVVNLSIIPAKCAIISLYLQIFYVKLPLRIACYFGYFLTLCAYIPGTITACLWETPGPGEHWDIVVTARAIRELPLGISRSTIGTVLDIYLFVLPIASVVRLRMSRRRKVAIIAVFTTAFLGVIASVCALVFTVRTGLVVDQQWNASIIVLCNIVETWIAVGVASTPGVATFFKARLLDSSLGTRVASILGLSRAQSSAPPARVVRHLPGRRDSFDPSLDYYELRNGSQSIMGWNMSVSSQGNNISKTVRVSQHYEQT